MAMQIGTRSPAIVRPAIHLPTPVYFAILAAAILLGLMVVVGPGRGVRDGLSAAAVDPAADGCALETDYVPTATSYTFLSVLVCWDRDANLQVLSPERGR